MPQKVTDAEGKEHTVYTDAEIAELAAGKTKEKDDEIAKLVKELDDLKNSDKDWASVRGQIKTLEGNIEKLTKERDEDRTNHANEIRNVRTGLLSGAVDTMRGGLASGDAELDKKIKFHYDRLAGDVTNETEAAAKLQDAFLLATGKQAPNPLSVARGSGGGQPPVQQQQVTQQVTDLGRKFGISDDDIKKFGPKAAEKSKLPNN